MAIKKAEYAMISNLFRNGFNPLMVFVLATLASLFFLLLDQIYRFLLDIILTINF